MASPDQRKLAAIMFTDMVGFSALSQRNEALALELLEEHRAIVRRYLPPHDGREVKTMGDGFLIEFPSALEAVQAAVDTQTALHERNAPLPPERRIQLRIGIHVGDVVSRGGDIHGDGVNIAARLEPLAIPGGICVSEDVERQVRNKLSLTLASLRAADLKNISLPVAVHRVVLPWEPAPARALTTATGRRLAWSWIALVVMGLLILGGALFLSRPTKTSPVASAPVAAAAPVDKKSIAVLAFANLSDDKGNEYFSDGISEELLNVLSKVPGLKVSARTSAFHFKGKDTSIPEIAKQLGVAFVVEGSVRKSGNRVRITAQLINAATGFHVWSDNFDREVKDIFVVQDEIAGLIAKNLKLKLAVSSAPGPAGVNPEAYQLYLEGRQEWTKRTNDGMKQAAKLFQQAIDSDPNFARAYVGLADTSGVRLRGRDEDNSAGLKALQLVDRALQLDPNLAEAHASRGNILDALGRRDEAKAAFERALALNPNYATAHQWYGRLLWGLGDMGRAEMELRRAEELDPLAPIMAGNYGLYLNSVRRYREALAAGDRAVALQAGFAQGQLVRGQALLGLKRLPEAALLFREIISTPDTGGTFRRAGFLEAQLALAGDPAPAQAQLAELQAATTRDSLPLAYLLMALGRRDEALAELSKPQEMQGDTAYYFVLPVWDPVRNDPRFLAVIEQYGLTDTYRAKWRQIEESQAREGAK